MKILIVTDEIEAWSNPAIDLEVMDANQYLLDYNSSSKQSTRIINLCKSYRYQTVGYYVSLLAAARGHKAIPTVLAIQDLKHHNNLDAMISTTLSDQIQSLLAQLQGETFSLSVYFGQNLAKRYHTLANRLYQLLPIPLFRVDFVKRQKWRIQKIESLSYEQVPENHRDFMHQCFREYLEKRRYYIPKQKVLSYDIAMLYKHDEVSPPSNKGALKAFIKAGQELGINVELVEKDDLKILSDYDGLFIRETTSVNHYSYRLARKAMAEGLQVIDDPVSILKCANKVYLSEIFNKHHIKMPKTILLTKSNWIEQTANVTFPLVIKQPDSAFSKGVVKVNSEDELASAVKQLLKASDIIVAQEFLKTDYDWRIGVLNHQPLYACKYYMAKDHWQIYNWESKNEKEGLFETMPVDQVPKFIIDTAVRSAKLIGNSLYGIDIKEIDGKAYVIEINDNPNIDHGIEDQVLGHELYLTIMQEFLTRIKSTKS